MEKCKNCLWFTSYRQVYEDELEPEDSGFCNKEKTLVNYKVKHVSEDEACSDFVTPKNFYKKGWELLNSDDILDENDERS